MRLGVRRIRDLGTNRVLELQVPDGPAITVRMTASADFDEGDVVAVEVDPASVYIYPGLGGAER